MIRVGLEIYGSCEGYFGRDFYGPARVEAIGHDWIVVRDESGMCYFSQFTSEDLDSTVEKWTKKE
jgi:hypothetical protein